MKCSAIRSACQIFREARSQVWFISMDDNAGRISFWLDLQTYDGTFDCAGYSESSKPLAGPGEAGWLGNRGLDLGIVTSAGRGADGLPRRFDDGGFCERRLC